ncbi:hypothetical protein FIBSPDRAFT_764258, partial [Athelia psychrophila]
LVPETYTPFTHKWTAARLRASTHDERFDAPLDGNDIDVMRVVVVSCYKLFQRMTYDRMALLNAWNALLLGILYLAFQAFQFIFAKHGFTGGTLLGIEVGVVGTICHIPFWNRLFAKETLKSNGRPPPETPLYMGQFGRILVPIGLFAFAFKTYASVP